MLDFTEANAADTTAVACRTLEKLLLEFEKFLPTISTSLSPGSNGSSLIADLGRGLSDKHYNSSTTKPYLSSSVC